MKFGSWLWGLFREGLFRAVALGLLLVCAVAHADVDPSFHPEIAGLVSTVAVQPDGKILVGGNFSAVNGVERNFLARLNTDGSLDSSFAPTTGPAEYVNRVSIVNSKIYVAAGDGLWRFDLNGALEWHYPMAVAAFAVDSQQRVLFGGQFTRVENQPHRNIARLTAAGALDTSFTAAVGCCAGDGVSALATASDALLVGGYFQSVNGTTANNFTRLNSDGSLDLNFGGNADSLVLAIAPTADGKILRQGQYTLARHLADGANDPSFLPVNADGSAVERFTALAIQNDGKIVIGGAPSFIARFNTNGTRDVSFAAQPDGVVDSVAAEASGNVLIAGSFSHVDGQPRSGLARIVPSSRPAPALTVTLGLAGTVVLSWPAEFADYALQFCELNSTTWQAVSNAPVTASGRNSITIDAAHTGGLFRLACPL